MRNRVTRLSQNQIRSHILILDYETDEYTVICLTFIFLFTFSFVTAIECGWQFSRVAKWTRDSKAILTWLDATSLSQGRRNFGRVTYEPWKVRNSFFFPFVFSWKMWLISCDPYQNRFDRLFCTDALMHCKYLEFFFMNEASNEFFNETKRKQAPTTSELPSTLTGLAAFSARNFLSCIPPRGRLESQSSKTRFTQPTVLTFPDTGVYAY